MYMQGENVRKLTQDELAIIERVRETEHGTVEIQIRDKKIVNIAQRKTYLPPSMQAVHNN